VPNAGRTRANTAGYSQRTTRREIYIVHNRVIDRAIGVRAFFRTEVIEQIVDPIDIEAEPDRVIPARQRDRVGILPALLVRKCSPFEERRFAEGETAVKKNLWWLAVRAFSRALRRAADNSTLAQQEFNRAFVLMQYFGYLRRNPNDAPDSNFDAYNFWLTKLNSFNGNFLNAEMVKAFLLSDEYKHRFGP